MIWPGCEQLKLGKSSAFVKRDIRSLPLTDAEFEADFFLDRRSSTKRRELWKGLVIEREAIFSQPDIAKTKKFRPRLEVVAETGQAANLSIDEWGRIMLALCGRKANREPGVCKHLLMLAGKIATSLSEALPIDGPPWAGGRWKGG
jgi:hypothetical protein